MKLTSEFFKTKWNIGFEDNDVFTIEARDLREFAEDIADSFGAPVTAPGTGSVVAELVLPMAVVADGLYVTATAIWQARSSFNASAPPKAGPNWRLVASFRPEITTGLITDASAAGRQLLTSSTAEMQLSLLDVLDIKAGAYGPHPAFSRAYTASGLLLYLLKAVMQLNAAVVVRAAAPSAGVVDDIGDTFSFLPNPAYPSFAQYKVVGLPGVTGAVVLDGTNSYVQGSRIYIKVVGPVAKGGLAVYVAGSGNVPDGAVLTNADPFTGTVVTPPVNQAPSVTINGSASGTVGTQQNFQAIASDSDGTVEKVELCLMANASTLTSYTVLDTDLVSPFVLNWTPSSAGNFNLRMRATDDKGASSFSSVLAVQVAVASGPLKVLVFDHGTSLEQADQATLDKYGQNYQLYTGTTALQAAQDAKGSTGRASSVEQLADLWNAENNGITLTGVNLGYPGKDAYYFERNVLSKTLLGYDPDDYDFVVHLVSYGVNGVEPDQPGDSTDPADLAASVKRICAALVAPDPAKHLAFVVLPANRTFLEPNGTPTPVYVNFEPWRTMYSAALLQNLSTFAKGADNIYEYDLGQAGMCYNYPNSLVVDGVHYTYLGQGQRAKSKARMLARFFGKTLSFGNGVAPAAPAAATLAISPASGVATVQREATLVTGASYTKAELFEVNPLGVSYSPKLIGSGSTVNFTPSDTRRYYYRLTLANGSYLYTSNFATATVTNGSNPSVTKQLVFDYRQWFGKQAADGSMAKVGGDTNVYSGQACASDLLAASRLHETNLSFPAARPGSAAAEYNVGVASGPPPRGTGINTATFGWRLSKDYIEVLNGSTVAFSKAWDTASSLLEMQFLSGYLVFSQDGNVLVSFPAQSGSDYYVNVCARGNSAVIPAITATSRALVANPMDPVWAGKLSVLSAFFEKAGTWQQGGPNNDEMFTQTPGSFLRCYVEDVSSYTLECAVDGNTQAELRLDGQVVGAIDGTSLPAGVQSTRDFGALVGGHFLSTQKAANGGNYFISFTSGTGKV